MKKIALVILTIALVAIMAVTFVACSTATVQGQLKNVWRPYEKYTYSVTDGTTTGTYVVEISQHNGGNVTIGTVNLENAGKGIIVSGKLTFANVQYETSCYVQHSSGGNFLVPKASYRKHVVDGNTTLELVGKYDGSTFTYSGTENGADKNGTIATKNPCYDNNEIHQLLRGVANMSVGFSFSFNVPLIVGESSLASLSVSCSAVENLTYKDTAYECYSVSLIRSTKVQGKSHTLYYTTKPVVIDQWELPYVLIKFVEPTANGEMVYTLTDIALA
jgi:hypothetical protein